MTSYSEFWPTFLSLSLSLLLHFKPPPPASAGNKSSSAVLLVTSLRGSRHQVVPPYRVSCRYLRTSLEAQLRPPHWMDGWLAFENGKWKIPCIYSILLWKGNSTPPPACLPHSCYLGSSVNIGNIRFLLIRYSFGLGKLRRELTQNLITWRNSKAK